MISIDQLKNKESVTNLWPIPVAKSSDFTAFNYSSDTKPAASDYNGGMLIDSTSISTVQNTGIEANNKSILLQPGTYVFSAHLTTTGTFTTQDAVVDLFSDRFLVAITPSDFNAGITSKTFTLTSSVNVVLQYKVPPNAKTIAYGCGLYSIQDWNKLQNVGARWFNPIDKTYVKTSQLTTAWTGTANASASTLSQDGKVIATNIEQKPDRNGWNNRVYRMSGTKQSDGRWKYDFSGDNSSYNWGTFCPPSDNDAIPVGSYIVAIYDASGPNVVGAYQGVNIITSTQHMFVGQVTATGDHVLSLSGNSSWVILTHYGIYSAAHWAAMQALGINWFSGDTYSKLDSLQNIASDADFLGAVNASPSVMTVNKTIMRNIIPCPQTMHLADTSDSSNFRRFGTGTCENMPMSDCPVSVTSGVHVNGNNTGACIDDKTLPNGDYVFAVYAKAAVGVGIELQTDWKGSSAGGTKYFIGDGKWHQYFTTGNITNASVSYARIFNSSDNGGAVGDVYFAAPIFCTVSDWNMLQYTDNQYFDGSTNLLSNNYNTKTE
jgi:hypothetical protein